MTDALHEPSDPLEEITVDDRRRLEKAMVAVRWNAVLLGFLVFLVIPPSSRTMAVAATAGLAVGNAVLMLLLQQATGPRDCLVLGGLATALEWLAAAGAILADTATSPNPLLAALIILVLIDGIRYGLAGVAGAWAVAAIVAGAALGQQISTLRVLQPALGLAVLIRWEALLLVGAVVIAVLLRCGQERLRQDQGRRERLLQQLRDERSQWETERAALRRAASRVSDREGEILRLLARSDLTYEQIAEALDVSADTVKTHVHRLAKKLGVSGRHSLVEAARARNLLPPAE